MYLGKVTGTIIGIYFLEASAVAVLVLSVVSTAAGGLVGSAAQDETVVTGGVLVLEEGTTARGRVETDGGRLGGVTTAKGDGADEKEIEFHACVVLIVR